VVRYNAQRKLWDSRDVPLTDEELECWEEQARWLVCPISGKVSFSALLLSILLLFIIIYFIIIYYYLFLYFIIIYY
jgi:hypothetical protein